MKRFSPQIRPAGVAPQKDNRAMDRILAALLVIGCAAAACSPTFNWREVRTPQGGLAAMLPCKPENGERTVPMAGRQVNLQALSCSTGGATFALLTADIEDPERAGEVLAQWKAATLANLRSPSAQESAFQLRGARNLPQSVQVVASGQRADGSKVKSQAAYFARDSRVFQAVIYAGQLKPDMVEPFFSALKFE
jgi:hypothetical protein